jgi:hypothetical protein
MMTRKEKKHGVSAFIYGCCDTKPKRAISLTVRLSIFLLYCLFRMSVYGYYFTTCTNVSYVFVFVRVYPPWIP